MLSIVVNKDYELEQLDVKMAFLHGDLDERIFLNEPEGFVKPGMKISFVFYGNPCMD